MKLHFPRIPSDDPAVEYEIARARARARVKIIIEIREKYAEVLRAAPWWKKPLIYFHIHHEANRIFRQLLYAR